MFWKIIQYLEELLYFHWKKEEDSDSSSCQKFDHLAMANYWNHGNYYLKLLVNRNNCFIRRSKPTYKRRIGLHENAADKYVSDPRLSVVSSSRQAHGTEEWCQSSLDAIYGGNRLSVTAIWKSQCPCVSVKYHTRTWSNLHRAYSNDVTLVKGKQRKAFL